MLRNASGVASAIGGTLARARRRRRAAAALPVEPNGHLDRAVGDGARARRDSRSTRSAATGSPDRTLATRARVDGGPQLELYGANIRGGGAFKGNAIGVHTFGNANNPVNGAIFLQNGLQLYPSTGDTVALTLNAYGHAPQVLNLYDERQRDGLDAVGVAGRGHAAAEQRPLPPGGVAAAGSAGARVRRRQHDRAGDGSR